MCSVFGYIGNQYSRNLVLKGLQKLEYRGYDSAGFACLQNHTQQLVYVKSQGSLDQLQDALNKNPIDGYSAIGHTRWATHGGFSLENAHPHFDCHKTIAIMHNGIIENHALLRHELVTSGHIFHSQTDTEVVAHLFEELTQQPTISIPLLSSILARLEGAYAIVAMLQVFPDQLIVARKRSPLCIGIASGAFFVASDPLAFSEHTNRVVFLPEDSCALISTQGFQVYDKDGNQLSVSEKNVQLDVSLLDKKGHQHFMLKEIYEQKNAIYATLASLNSLDDAFLEQIGLSVQQLAQLKRINLIGCGTSWYAGRIAQFFLEQIAQIPTSVHLASEFRYMPFFYEPESLCIAISQSGETADTLEAVRMIQRNGLHTIALSNVASSSMVRESHGYFLTKAGQEVAVASTKAFVTQMTALYWFACKVAIIKGLYTKQQFEAALADVYVAAEVLEESVERYKEYIKERFAPFYAQYKHFIFLGRHINYPFAMEAALKLKELSYLFAQSYPAGELKHGPLALVDASTPVVVFSHTDELIYHKLVANVQEVKARDGHVIVFAFEGQKELLELADTAFILPYVKPLVAPIAMSGLMQYCVYEIALFLQRPIDKPRNLAKSVTVE